MASEDRFEVDGTVVEKIKGGKFKVKVDNTNKIVTCTLSGKIRQNQIKIVIGDKVTIDLSTQDPKLENGRIVWRMK